MRFDRVLPYCHLNKVTHNIDNTVPVVQKYRVSIISICVIKRLFVLPTDELRGSRAVHAVKVGMLALARRFPYRVLSSPV